MAGAEVVREAPAKPIEQRQLDADVVVSDNRTGAVNAVNHLLAAGQGLFNAQTPLTLAETASVFGEALTFQRLLAAEPDPGRRLELLVGRLEDAIATTFRTPTLASRPSRLRPVMMTPIEPVVVVGCATIRSAAQAT